MSRGVSVQRSARFRTETRILREVSADAIRHWAEQLRIIAVRGRFNIVRAEIQLRPTPDNATPVPHPEILSGFTNGGVDYRFMRRAIDETYISVGDLLSEPEPEVGTRGKLEGPVTITASEV